MIDENNGINYISSGFELTEKVRKKLLDTLSFYGNVYMSEATYKEMKDDLKKYKYTTTDSCYGGYIITLEKGAK